MICDGKYFYLIEFKTPLRRKQLIIMVGVVVVGVLVMLVVVELVVLFKGTVTQNIFSSKTSPIGCIDL